MPSDSPDRSASCGLHGDSGKPGRHGFPHRARNRLIWIKKEPGSLGSQALQAGTGPEDSRVAHVRPEGRMAAIVRCHST
jgi:hypothetical protein